MEYNLAVRTKLFSLNLIKALKQISITYYNRNIIEQLIRSATSIGANYYEANGAVSKNDFRTKIALCKKESLETKYWIELLINLSNEYKLKLSNLERENYEFTLIFSRILKTIRSK